MRYYQISMRIVVTFLMIFPFLAVSAQIQRVNVSGSASYALTISPQRDNTVLGSPYLNAEYMFGKVEIENEPTIETLIRYNVYHKELEMIYGGDTTAVIRPFLVDHFILNSRRFIYSMFIEGSPDRESISADYFEVLSNGNLQLLAKHYTEIETNSYATNYGGGGGDGRDYFVHKSTIFYREGDKSAARKLNRKKKRILDLMADRKQDMSVYIKQSKLNLRKNEDLIKLFDHYNNLNL